MSGHLAASSITTGVSATSPPAREYQQRMFEIAKQRNTLCVLPTGSGKTLIALLLIKHVAQRDAGPASASRKVSVFLAPQVPLVAQQCAFLRQNCDFDVRMFHGDLRIEQWNQEKWKAEISACGCLVMTPAIFEVALRRAHLRMGDINLIVFDEAHHARKNSAYNQIIAMHYLPCVDSEKPLLFGMTASPVSTSTAKNGNLDLSIRQLETNLCCKAVTFDTTSDLQEHTAAPTKRVVIFHPHTQQSRLLNALREHTTTSTDVYQLKRLVNEAVGVLEDFGAFVCDAFLASQLRGLWTRVVVDWQTGQERMRPEDLRKGHDFDEGGDDMEWSGIEPVDEMIAADVATEEDTYRERLQAESEVNTKNIPESDSVESSCLLDAATASTQDVERERKAGERRRYNAKYRAFLTSVMEELVSDSSYEAFSLYGETGALSDEILALFSSKFLTLVDILATHKAETGLCGIVFVERRCTAFMMGTLLPRVARLKELVKVGVLVGHSGSRTSRGTQGGLPDFQYVGIHQRPDMKGQQATVNQFRQGATNLLIATQVAEEGIDIQPCNLVVRFDAVNSVISNIQSRGRARHKDSVFVLMFPHADTGALSRMNKLESNEEIMQDILHSKMNTEEGEIDDTSSVPHDIAVTPETVYTVPNSGATMTIYHSIAAVHQYCSTLPADAFATLKPIFSVGPVLVPVPQGHGVGWIASVQMPVNAPASCRLVSGRPCGSIADAKRSAALETVRALHLARVLNDQLKPIRFDDALFKTLRVEDALEGEKEGSKSKKKKGMSLYKKHVPQGFQASFPRSVPLIDGLTTVHRGQVVLFRVHEDGGARVLEFGLLIPFYPSDCVINDTHVITIDAKPVQVDIAISRVGIAMTPQRTVLFEKFSNAILFNGLLRTQSSPLVAGNEYLLPMIPFVNGEDAWLKMEDGDMLEALVDWKLLSATAMSPYSELKCQVSLDELKDQPGFRNMKSEYFGLQPESDFCIDFKALFAEFGSELVVNDCAYWDRKYQLLDVIQNETPFSTGESGFDSVADFYKLRLRVTERVCEDQPVLLASSLPHMHQSGKAQRDPQNDIVRLIPQFCSPFPIPASLMMQSAVYMPLLIQDLYHRLCAVELQESLQLVGQTSPGMFQAALTASVTIFAANYERLEFLGDAFMKMNLSLHLFAHHPTQNEGFLSETRSSLERNDYLLKLSIRCGLPGALAAEPVSRKTWKPPLRVSEDVRVTDKAAADIVEAIVGACVVSTGHVGGAKAVHRFFGDTFLARLEDYSSLVVRSRPGSVDGFSDLSDAGVVLASKLEKRLGYMFKNVSLAVEALTHASAVGMYGLSSCFQRLEFLGDAVLGYLAAKHLYELPENFDPGNLTNLKTELVNNQFLSIVSFQLGLQKLIFHASSSLAFALSDFGNRIDAAQANNVNKKLSLFWHNLPPAPKTTSDVLESLIGAIFVDSGFDVDVVAKVVDRIVIRPWWPVFVVHGPTTNASNALGELHLFMQETSCKAIGIEYRRVDGTGEVECKILRHGSVIALALADSQRVAKKLAATEAMPKLQTIPTTCCVVSDLMGKTDGMGDMKAPKPTDDEFLAALMEAREYVKHLQPLEI